ncbi:MAG: hypothetical protein LBQ30_08555 [Treponema sp.]|jgi:hypothetical protein|nr:hypothetical protein [Treponema sp.]
MTISTDLEFEDFKQRIEQFEHEMPKIAKKMMNAVFTPMRSVARRLARSKLKRGRGRLFGSINYWAFDDWSGSITTRKNARKDSAFYASFDERGIPNIQAKNEREITYTRKKTGTIVHAKVKYLTFKINGQWKRVSSVSLPARPFMQPAFNTYFGGSGERAKKLMDARLQKEMNRILEKHKEQ